MSFMFIYFVKFGLTNLQMSFWTIENNLILLIKYLIGFCLHCTIGFDIVNYPFWLSSCHPKAKIL